MIGTLVCFGEVHPKKEEIEREIQRDRDSCVPRLHAAYPATGQSLGADPGGVERAASTPGRISLLSRIPQLLTRLTQWIGRIMDLSLERCNEGLEGEQGAPCEQERKLRMPPDPPRVSCSDATMTARMRATTFSWH